MASLVEWNELIRKERERERECVMRERVMRER